ncbi:DNA polymerase III subunit delta' [Desulfovibrio ferrophilus]|uniref:Putative DNA polymerase III, delta prime subunit n=1 Tax=Desulfovibrio ferrophilus TaxID=241368 RepID=A0A2Z6B2N7_9BACT|nr:DNA polymerase III subunit delta' [Desulfovibrio ferrophilus]BBD09723.1 putative DNA polymerase III, delta prime subunit [Desulfovibrio ferrophilus]
MNIPNNQIRIKDLMDRLADDPPQVLLLEGGTVDEREALALYWATRLNCHCEGSACGDCVVCKQIHDRVHADLRICDGREAKIKIDDVRELKHLFGQPPRGDGKRVVIFNEAQELTQQAANALLKSLEEPSQGTVFLLLTPQREWLLPTLVSRSWVLTLAWPSETRTPEDIREWQKALMAFWRTGKGWFKRTSAKGAVDKDIAMSVVLACQHEVARTLIGKGGSDMSDGFAKVRPASLKKIDLALAHAQDTLSIPTPVNPALVLDWLATRIYGVIREK